MADTDGKASELAGCDAEVPLLGVTREFDFGQFIELFDETDAGDRPSISRIVIQPSASLAADRDAVSSEPPAAAAPQAVGTPPGGALTVKSHRISTPQAPLTPGSSVPVASGREPEVDFIALTERGPGAKLTPVSVQIADTVSFFKTGVVQVGDQSYKVPANDTMRDSLSMGLSVTAFASPVKGGAAVPLKLSLPFRPIELNQASLAQVLAGNALDSPSGGIKPMLTAGAIRTLLAGGSVLTHTVDPKGNKSPVALHAGASGQQPMSNSFQLFDLPAFIVAPAVLAKNGARMPVDLTAHDVEQLLGAGRLRLSVDGHEVDITVMNDVKSPEFVEYFDMLEQFGAGSGLPPVKPLGIAWAQIIAMAELLNVNPHFVHPFLPDHDSGLTQGGSGQGSGNSGGGGSAVAPAAGSMTSQVQPRLPSGSGLPVAVFVPWKQTWTLKGFSRGNLLHSIALAPSEQVTMQVNSWERRSRSLEQSSETEVDQQTDITQSTRDTEDVFKEMLAKRDFAWQLSGSIDASYSPGVASIKVHAGGAVSDTSSIQQTARNSSQSVREATVKASSRVRSKRVTRITQTVDSGKEERVTRVISNPNQCHTLTLDFFETLAHYQIDLAFQRDRLRLVVLIANPIQVADFTSGIVRRNETALRNALIETALADGFDACRLVAAYGEAQAIVSLQKSAAAIIDEPSNQRDQKPETGLPDPAAPQEADVMRVVGEMVTALKKIRLNAGVDAAFTAIAAHKPVSEALRQSGQQWLFINLCASKLPSLLPVLDEIAAPGGPTGMAAAQKILSVLPRPDAATNLGNLNQVSDQDKELACIASKLKEENSRKERIYMKMDWDWGWWTTRLKEESLYSANDAGIAGAADRLQRAYQAWEAKKAQGDAMKDQDVAKTEAEGKQDKASTDDKLSMSFPLEDLAHAYERMKVLLDHLNEHQSFYNYALFQALPPSEQALRLIEASNGKLQVGLFEPRVVAMSGARLVVPLTPLAGSAEMQAFVTSLGASLETAFAASLSTPDTAILPTPGVSVSSRLGKCSGCEEFIESSREHELTRLAALARQEVLEADRRAGRIAARNFDDFHAPPAAVKLEIESTTPARE